MPFEWYGDMRELIGGRCSRSALLLVVVTLTYGVNTTLALERANRPQPPFVVLYSNDTTHTMSCKSPYHKGKRLQHNEATNADEEVVEPFSATMLDASVDETANTGVDAHLLQPGFGWVPWWKSNVYSFEEHRAFMKEHFQSEMPKGSWTEYMSHGGDMVDTFSKRCRQTGLKPFVSIRLNDVHGHETANLPPGPRNEIAWATMAPIHVNHPDWRLGKNILDWPQRPLNWVHPEPREYKLQLIQELCQKYQLTGIELDFMRFPYFFREKETTSEQRKEIMLDFIRRTRKILDDSSADGEHRWLCVRVPALVESHNLMGIDLVQWVQAGVEMINASYFYFTSQDGNLAELKKQSEGAALYVEMCHTTRVGPTVGDPKAYDAFAFRRTTDIQFYTTAHLAYARGCAGISLFNFVYFREHGTGLRGPFHEPPFHIIRHLRDRDWLAMQPQHYFLSEVWDAPKLNRQLPKSFEPQEVHHFHLDMAPPAGGWTEPGRLRIQSSTDLKESKWQCRFNGEQLEPTEDRSEPFDNPYVNLLGEARHHRAWTVPVALMVDGINEVEITLASDDLQRIIFLDVSIARTASH
jgi:hypothetical protein